MEVVREVMDLACTLNPEQLKDVQLDLLERTPPRYLGELFVKINELLAFDILSKLPKELAELVLSHLDAAALCSAAQCCKHWRELANNDEIWRALCSRKGFLIYENLPLPSWGERNRPTSPRRKMHDISAIPSVLVPPMCYWKQVYMRASVLTANWRYGVYSVAPLLRGHKSSITALSVEDDLLVSSSRDGSVLVWSLQSLEQACVLAGHTDEVNSLVIKDGLVVTGSSDGLVRVFDTSSGQCLWSLNPKASAADLVAFSGIYIFSAHADSSVQIWAFEKGRPIHKHALHGHTMPVTYLGLNGDTAISGSWDGSLRVWKCDSGINKHIISAHLEGVYCCQFDEDKIVSGGGDCRVVIWDMASGKDLGILTGHSQEILCVQYNERIIVSSSADSSIKIWDFKGLCLYTLGEHLGLVRCLCLDGSRLVSGGDRKRINVWDVRSGQLLHTVHRQQILLHLMCVTDTQIITGSPDNGVISIIGYW